MLQKLREHSSGWIAKIILFLLVVVFSFWGIESYFVAQTDTSMATVDKTVISQQQFQDEMSQLRQQARDPSSGITNEDFSRPEFRRQVLERLINQALLHEANADMGVVITDAMVRNEIAGIDAFHIQGKFDPTTYQAILGQQGMSPAGFEQSVRRDLQTQVIPQAVQRSALVTRADVDTYLRLSGQKRDVHYVDLPPAEIDVDAITEADVDAWYAGHPDDFMTEETVSVQYLEIRAADMRVDAKPDDAELRARYEQERARFVVPEEREVAHILVALPANADADAQKAALARADVLEARLADGEDFAAVAREDSDDLGSRRQGGDLGWIETGMLDTAFEEVAFSLAKGEVSAPVLTSEGYHIIRVNDIKAGHARPLDEVRDELADEMLESERERMFNDTAGRLVDLVYQDPTSLRPAAEALGLEVHTTPPFPRVGGSGIAAHPEVVREAFSHQVLDQGMNSEPINIDGNHLVVLRLDKHATAKPKPLADVREEARSAVVAERTAAASRARAEALLADVRAAGSLAAVVADDDTLTVMEAKDLERISPALLPAIVEEIFKLPAPEGEAPTFGLASAAGTAAWTLIQLDAVRAGEIDDVPAAQRQLLAAQLRQLYGSTEMMSMLQVLRAGSKVRVNEDQLLVRDEI